MRDLTPDQFIKAAREAGHTARILPSRAANEPPGVNVWLDPGVPNRIPDTTVWWPRPNNPTDEIIWGSAWQYAAHRDITAEGLVEKVKESLSPADRSGSPPKE